MNWYIQPQSKRILALEDEAEALCEYAGFEDFVILDFALDLVDAIVEMGNQADDAEGEELYHAALSAFCKNPEEYVLEQANVYEYQIDETAYNNERGFCVETAEEMEELLIARGMVMRALIPQERSQK